MVELDIGIIAEGVETQDQAEYLMDCGCMICQGFLFYRPMPAKEFYGLIEKEK